MIWFECKQCHKKLNRPDNQAGSLVFCTCGTNLRVPWNSTAEPDAEPAPAPPPRPRAPAPPPSRRYDDPEDDRGDDRRDDRFPDALPVRRQVRLPRKVNPAFCWNHDETASAATCAACRLPLCPACVVTLQGETLCGPCKNFRIARLGRPARLAPMAVVALVVSLVAGPVTLVLTIFAIGLHIASGNVAGSVLLCLVGLAMPVGGLILAGLALKQIETKPEVGGRAMASGGACAALASGLWSVTVAVLLIVKAIGG